MIRQYRAVYDLPSRMYAEVQLTGESSEDVAIALVEAEVKEQTGYRCAEITKVPVTNNPNMRISEEEKWVVTSTWGEHHIIASDEQEAEEAAEKELADQGYADPENMIMDGLTTEYDPELHGDW